MTNPTNTVYATKRLIGRTFKDEQTQKEMKVRGRYECVHMPCLLRLADCLAAWMTAPPHPHPLTLLHQPSAAVTCFCMNGTSMYAHDATYSMQPTQ